MEAGDFVAVVYRKKAPISAVFFQTKHYDAF